MDVLAISNDTGVPVLSGYAGIVHNVWPAIQYRDLVTGSIYNY